MNERWLEILLTPMCDQITVAETCRRYGISRQQSFYVYQRRLYADGVAALAPLSRRPLRSPAQTLPDLEAEIVRIRKANPRWGARTIHTQLVRSGAPHVPAVSTIHRVLQRNSLITPRTQRRAVPSLAVLRTLSNQNGAHFSAGTTCSLFDRSRHLTHRAPINTVPFGKPPNR